MTIIPETDVLLIEVAQSKYGAIPTNKANYKDDATFGKVIGVNPNDKDNQRFMGKTVYFEQFKDSCRVENDKQALIKVSDVMGSSDGID